MTTWITIGTAGFVVVILGWILYRQFSADHIARFNERRRATSLFVSRGELVDGNRHLEVALALTHSSFFFENQDMQASFDLDRIREIEYDSELSTGTAVEGGKVLRLRSDSQIFEFVISADSVASWQSHLPPRSSNNQASGPDAGAVLVPQAVPAR